MRPCRMLLFIIGVMLLVIPTAAPAKVVSAVLNAAPAEYRGGCPAVITFNGTITVDKPGSVKYIFTRSDGAIDTITKTLLFKAAGTKPVTETWTLGGDVLPYYNGWEAIKILGRPPVFSKQAGFSVRCNPPLNSALAAHGNTDWHLNTANEFLFGTDMGGTVMSPNHAPDPWTKRHIHVGLTNTSKYYYDKSHTTAGEDTNGTNGIDTPMLFFYAGHGNPNLWNTLGDNASQPNMVLANVTDNGGRLRYYWQCSCEVFAHGPRTCSGTSMEYSCPGSFTGGPASPDTYDMRNVFARWGPVLRPDLRMACGASTLAYCWYDNVDKIWDDFNNHGMSVAESFIDGLSGAGVVPLCITMGGSDITKTPLYDTAFTNEPNTSGTTHYHIMYLGGAAGVWIPGTLAQLPHIPKMLPKFRIIPPEPPARLRALDLRGGKSVVADFSAFVGGKAQVRREEVSGAVYLKSVQQPPGVEAALEKGAYIQRANALVHELGWETKELGEPIVTPVLTASMPIGASANAARQEQKSVLVTYSRQIEVEGQKVDVIGGGGLVRVSLSNAGVVLHASRVWRQIQAPTANVNVKSFEQARDQAVRRLTDPSAYKLDQWRWGYKELSGTTKQDELFIVFQFGFVPKDSRDILEHPPQLIEVLGEVE